MRFKIARIMLYSVVGIITIACILAMIDNYNLALIHNVTTKVSCDTSSVYNDTTKIVRYENVCSAYNPQFIFFSCLCIIVISIIACQFVKRIIDKNEYHFKKWRNANLDYSHNYNIKKNDLF